MLAPKVKEDEHRPKNAGWIPEPEKIRKAKEFSPKATRKEHCPADNGILASRDPRQACDQQMVRGQIRVALVRWL